MSRIAVFNAGTATLKVAVLAVNGESLTEQYRAEHAWPETADVVALTQAALEPIEAPIDAVAHRVVHGGSRYRDGVRLDDAVERAIEELFPLAPLHNARALEIIRRVKQAYPGIPAFAVFDTAFHARRSPDSMTYALPAALVQAFGLRRYGFHGIAHAAMTETLARLLGTPASETTAVTLQLGSGCSACAIEDGRSIETSMGYTPLEGLVMLTRSGDIDPAIVLALIRGGYEPNEIEYELTRRSGLLALSGLSDMREILAADADGEPSARLALALFVRRIVMTVGAYFTLLNGRGALVFGGGIGAHSGDIRQRIAEGLTAWNVEIDAALNAECETGRISTSRSRDVFVVQTDEEAVIAREAAWLLAQAGPRTKDREVRA